MYTIMPGTRRRTAAPARRVKRARPTRKRGMRMARTVNVKRDIYFFTRGMNNPGTYTGNVAYAPLLQASAFTFTSLVNASEFTALFDQYKITHVQVKFFLKIDPGAQSAAGASYPKLFTITDHDDESPPASLNVMREHPRCRIRVMNPNRPVTVNIKPAILGLAYKTAVASAYCPKWKQWIDCNDSMVPHYGLKWAIDDLTNTNYKVDTEVKMWFACRGAR